MVGEDRAAGLYALLGKCRHQLADGRAKCLPHFAAWHGQANDSGRLGLYLQDLRYRYHRWSPTTFVALARAFGIARRPHDGGTISGYAASLKSPICASNARLK